MIRSVGFIGSGNVASNLALAFNEQNIEIKFVFSKTKNNQTEFAVKFNCQSPESIEEFPEVDAIFICVNDDQIESVSSQLIHNDSTIVHCSGSVSLKALLGNKKQGVFYPFQSFTKHEKVNWKNIPILIEANATDVSEHLSELANRISTIVQLADSDQRKSLHLSGVLMNNFTNHLAVLGNQFLVQNKLDPSLLNALIEQTTDRILKGNPEKFQTGPAVRHDTKTINSHLDILENNANLKSLYQQFTDSIQSWKKDNK